MERVESRIVLDEADWAVRIGILQLALSEAIEDWPSCDGQYFYRLTSSYDPYEGEPAYDLQKDIPVTVPYPERSNPTGEVGNPAKWIVSRSLTSDILAERANPPVRTSNPSGTPKIKKSIGFVAYAIDEARRTIDVFDAPTGLRSGMEHRNPPVYQDIAELCNAMDDLARFLHSMK